MAWVMMACYRTLDVCAENVQIVKWMKEALGRGRVVAAWMIPLALKINEHADYCRVHKLAPRIVWKQEG